MTTINTIDIKKVHKHVKSLMTHGLTVDLIFHNWENTKKNVELIHQLSKKSNISEADKQVALIATYFLYTGFSEPDTEQPYNYSRELARQYLDSEVCSDTIQAAVDDCLMIREADKEANSASGRLFHDMLHAYFGQKKLKSRISKSLEERNLIKSDRKDLLTKYEAILERMKNHHYFTPAAKHMFTYKKYKNVSKLQSMIESDRKDNMLSSNKTAMTMFKTASRNHIDLINIADKKAGIMISINAIIMTLMIPILASYIIDVSKFIIPSVILILTCGTAVILATLATRPKISDGKTSAESKLSGAKSLFYFRNFYKMEKAEYQAAIKDVIVRETTLENSIINDLYDMGIVLGIKYQKLNWCYLIFAAGVGLTILSFVLSFFFFPEI